MIVVEQLMKRRENGGCGSIRETKGEKNHKCLYRAGAATLDKLAT